MFFVYLILLVWIGYALWFSYTLTTEQAGGDRRWYNPIVFFVAGVFAAVMIVVEFIEEAMGHAARVLHERAIRKRDAERAAKEQNK